MRIRLSRAVSFRAYHRLAEPDRSPAENRARFGWTSEPHPHRYRVEATVAGPVDPKLPMVMDLATLDRILAEEVVDRLGNRHLHRDLPEFERVPPTCEAIAMSLFSRIAPRLPPGVTLDRIVVAEDETLSAECRGAV